MPEVSPDRAADSTDVAESPASRRARIDRDYDNSAVFGDVADWREKWRHWSEAVPAGWPARLDLPYGSAPAQKLDVFPHGNRAAPTAVFIHGGFWTRNSKETFRFLVQGIHAAGCNAVFLGYTLAPNASMDRMVDEVRSGGRWLFSKLTELGLADRPLVVIGWSAGAQLAAMMSGEHHIAGGIGISGIYDLRPMGEASVNDALGMNQDDMLRNSPTLNPPRFSGRFVVAYGGRELPAFQAQSEQFYGVLRAAGLPGERLILPKHSHHSVLEDLYRPDGKLTQELVRLTS
jgi:arylformamidase